MKKLYLLFILVLPNVTSLWGQQNNTEKENANIPKIFPPSPSAYQLGNYGNLNIGEFTGTFQETINLMSYDIGNIKLPISLNYSSNGIKVDDYNSAVGLGWGLNAGGVISVISRGINDFISSDITSTSDTAPTPFKYRFIMDASTDNFLNTERDLYRLNVNGVLSTQFVIDGNRILEAKQSDTKISIVGNSFIVKDSQGTKYTFDLIESTTTRSTGAGWTMPNHNAFSAFYLTKIEDSKGNIVSISYETENSVYTLSQSQSYNFLANLYSVPSGCSPAKAGGLSPIIDTRINTTSYRIKQISNNRNNTLITFDYTNLINDGQNRETYLKTVKYTNSTSEIEKIEFNYSTTPNNRVFLNDLTYKDLTKKYSFTYNNPELLPKRLSLSQDYWGFYNGKGARSLVPTVEGFEYLDYTKSDRNIDTIKSKYGLLTEIKYPTKGYSKIEYENNDYYGKKIVLPPKVDEYLHIYSGATGAGSKNHELNSFIDQRLTMDLSVMYDNNTPECEGGDDTNRQRMTVRIFDKTNERYIKLYNTIDLFVTGYDNIVITKDNSGTYYADLKKDHQYRLEVSQLRPFCTRAFVSLNYYKDTANEFFTNLITGGNRVKNIQHFSGENTNMIRYYYADKADISKSSGDISYNPFFMKTITNLSYCSSPSTTPGEVIPGAYVDYKIYSIGSNSIISLFGNEGSGAQYKYVTKSFGGDNFENGGETKEFMINRDAVASHYFGTDSNEAQYSNSGWNNGIEKQNVIFDKNLNPIKETINEYIYNDNKKIEVNNIIVRENSKPSGVINSNLYNCKLTDINNTTYGYNPCKKLGDNFPYYTQDDMWIFYNAYQYKSYSHNFNLAKTITKDYLSGGTVTTETNYNYDSANHLQLTKQTTTNSKNESLTTEYQYPPDLVGQEDNMKELTDANRIAEPVVVKQSVDGVYVSEVHKQYSLFNGLIKESALHAKKGNGININTTTDRKITYNSYDAKGNLTQYTLENGIPVSIIWGYNGQYPIAKIEGTAYNQISIDFINELQYLSNQDNDRCFGLDGSCEESKLRRRLNEFRSNELFTNSMVTVYTYDPLIGVTSIIQPNGQTEYYKYDASNRLEEIRNDKQEVLKTFEYNYKQP